MNSYEANALAESVWTSVRPYIAAGQIPAAAKAVLASFKAKNHNVNSASFLNHDAHAGPPAVPAAPAPAAPAAPAAAAPAAAIPAAAIPAAPETK